MTGKKLACGGVIVDAEGRILLREPSGHFDGYVWTFSKGRPQSGETPEQAALRETLEETGVPAEIIARIAGTFAGGTTDNIYFLMRPTGPAGKPDKETARVRWATPDEARVLIHKTTNLVGRKRDLAVLKAALALQRRSISRDRGEGSMSRVPQKQASRGSQKWLQLLVNQAPHLLDRAIARHLGFSATDKIVWLSPLAQDGYAEYRDELFLSTIQTRADVAPLSGFWPVRGPQWDALGRTSRGEPLLIEAKAHIPELLSPPTQAGGSSLSVIRTSLDRVKRAVGSRAAVDWSGTYYQYTNRLAHLYFLRSLNRLPAYLVFVYLLNDADMQGPKTAEEWVGAIRLVHAQLGIDEALLAKAFGGAVIDVFIDVKDVAAAAL